MICCARFEEVDAILDETEELFCQLVKRLPSSNPKTVSGLEGMLTLLLHCAEKYKECCCRGGRAPAVAESRLEKLFKTVKRLMADEWIVKHYSASIGDGIAIPNRFFKCAKDDIEVRIYVLL